MNRSIFDEKWFSILISFLWGFGLALLFKRTCKNSECVIVKVPIQFHQNGRIIHDKNNRCYQLEQYTDKCTY